MNEILDFFLAGIIGIFGIRNLFWHLQNWQIREYRIDRMRAHLSTKKAQKNVWNFWFFAGVLPRPKISARVILIGFLALVFSGILIWGCRDLPLFLAVLAAERTLFLAIFLAVLISKIPAEIGRKIVFARAKKIILNSKNVVRIGITGSFGKSSTKTILHHLCVSAAGNGQVLCTKKNENNELAIARMIWRSRDFFENKTGNPRYFIVEMGAYCRGEIRKMAEFVRPQIGILTGISPQHLALFGSEKNIVRAKFELAEAAEKIVFFNAENENLKKVFADRKITATKVGIFWKTAAGNRKVFLDRTEFLFAGQNFRLNWPGEFFVANAVLALSVFAEIFGEKIKKAPKFLESLPPLERALRAEKGAGGATIFYDLYSQNPCGVGGAIQHLAKVSGQKILVGVPLLELGGEAKKAHQKIFESAKKIRAKVIWGGEDFADLGQEILGKNFEIFDKMQVEKTIKNLKKSDAVLISGRVPNEVLKIFDPEKEEISAPKKSKKQKAKKE